MSTIRRIGPKLLLCSILCGLFLIGWVTRNSIAQSRPQDPPPSTAPGGVPKEASPPASEAVKAEPSPVVLPGPDPIPMEKPESPSLKEVPSPEPLPSRASAPAPAPVVVGPDHAPIESEDPEKVAGEFLEQNRKLAETQVKALKEEAEKLRTRLAKVEGGIKRWDRLLEALKRSQGAVESVQAVSNSDDEVVIPGERPASLKFQPKTETEPTELSPVPPGAQGTKVPQAKSDSPRADVVPR
jgi:hypothetical protein